jgi:ribonuclease BN (tRNA processing enzyme)
MIPMSMQSARDAAGLASATRVVMLGTGSPRPDPDRSGPSTAIVVNGTPYLVDFGPGVIRRAAAAYRNGVTAFGPRVANLTTAFLTHLHSDHTMGYPDLIFTPWLMGRKHPLEVYGPKGLTAMTENILKAWDVDLAARTQGDHARPPCRVNSHEIGPGVIYTDDNITVTAFSVHHGEDLEAFGFRFETLDRTIVVSGDTSPVQSLIDHGRGCDVLIHEGYSLAGFDDLSPVWQEFRRSHHTSSRELAEIANELQPALLVLYHPSNAGGGPQNQEDQDILVQEIRSFYSGRVVAANDLDAF